ncbi:MAG: hypothetical protein ABSD96_14260 [Candidatus Korobacteraceae bacterium]|jgi:predicted RNA-binding Zn-ribbon protein involved in translation (DUF1610 family)
MMKSMFCRFGIMQSLKLRSDDNDQIFDIGESVSDGAEKKRYSVKSSSECPKCGKKMVFRSHRKGFMEKLRSKFGKYPFRCHACGYRFFRTVERRSQEGSRGA